MPVGSKEAVVIVLDVGRSMAQAGAGGSSKLASAKKAVELLVQQKILYSAKDLLALVLFGTDETENSLAEQLGGYEHVKVERDMGPATVDLLRSVPGIKAGTAEGDWLDALVVALDLLQSSTKSLKSVTRRVFMVTDAAGPVEDAEQLDQVLQQVGVMDCRLDVIGVDFGDAAGRAKTETKRKNEAMLRQVCEDAKGGSLIHASHAIEILSSLRSKSVKQVSTFRGNLEVTPELGIPVWCYTKTSEQRLPSLSKISVPAMEAGGATCKVKMDRVYRSQTNVNQEVGPDERMKGYKYGNQLVPFSAADEAAMKYTSERCLKCIAFIDRAKARRHHYLGSVDCITSAPGDDTAAVGLSALIHAMYETNRCMVARFVKRANSTPKLALLTPYIAAKDPASAEPAGFECLYVNQLPFSDDLREYSFHNFNDDDRFKPSLVQLAAAEELITGLDLMTAHVDDAGNATEALAPHRTFNPVLQRLYQALQARAMEPDCPLPALDPEIEKYVTPDAALFKRQEARVRAFRSNFELKKNDKKKTKKRRFWGEQLDAEAGVEETKGQPSDAKKARRGDDDDDDDDLTAANMFAQGPASAVGSVDPVKDFNSMLARRDDDWVSRAVEGMQQQIKRLVEEGGEDVHYHKAVDCLKALRAGCLASYDEESFNTFIKGLKSSYEKTSHRRFWAMVVTEAISLIDNEESGSACVSHITKADAKRFLDESAAAAPAPAPAPEPDEDEEDLFDDMD